MGYLNMPLEDIQSVDRAPSADILFVAPRPSARYTRTEMGRESAHVINYEGREGKVYVGANHAARCNGRSGSRRVCERYVRD